MELLKVLYSAVRKNSFACSNRIQFRYEWIQASFRSESCRRMPTLNLTWSQRHSFLLRNFQLSSGGTSVLVFFSRLLLEVYDTWHFLVQIKGEK